MHKYHNSAHPIFGVIALCWFSYLIFIRSITQKVFQVLPWNLIGGLILLKRSAVHKNHNSAHQIFGVIALCWFSYLIYVRSITQKAFQVSPWNLIGGLILLGRSAVHNKYNSAHHIFRVIALCWFLYSIFCPEHNSKSISGIILKLHRWIDLIKEKYSAHES